MSNRGPRSLPEFQSLFPDEAACRAFLFEAKYPDGFVCPYCAATTAPFRFARYPSMLRCRSCERNTHLTAGTVMHGSKVALSTWFWAAYLITSLTPGLSALQFQKVLGLGRYETAFTMLHKLRAALVRTPRAGIGGDWLVELDETLVGGATQGEGRGRHHKTLAVGAVEVRPRSSAPGPDPNLPTGQGRRSRDGHGRGLIAGRLRLQVVGDRSQASLESFARDNIKPGTTVHTDGWSGYAGLRELGFSHEAVSIDGDQSKTEGNRSPVRTRHAPSEKVDGWLFGARIPP